MGSKISEQEANQRDYEVGAVRIGDYFGANKTTEYLCKYCNKSWFNKPSNVWLGQKGHRNCIAKNNAITEQQANDKDKESGVTRIGKFNGTNEKTEYLCSVCNKSWSTRPSQIWYNGYKGHYKCRKETGYEFINGYFWQHIQSEKSLNRGNRKIKFLITIEEANSLLLKQNFKCYYSGLDIHIKMGKFDNNENTASLDRVDSNKDYQLDNCVWCHKDINNMKWNLSKEEFISWCKKVTQNYE